MTSMASFYQTNVHFNSGKRRGLPTFFRVVLFVLMMLLPLTVSAQDDNQEQQEIDSILASIHPDTPDSIKAQNYCMVSYLVSNVDSCIKYAFLSLNHCKETDTLLIADNTRYIAWGYWMNDDPKMALPYLHRSTNLYKQVHDTASIEHNYRLMSKLYDKLNISDSVNYCINQAMEIDMKQKDTFKIAQCYIDMSEIYLDKHFYSECENCIRKALRLDSLINDTLEYARCYYRLSEVYCETARTTAELLRTKEYLHKAIDIFDQINSGNSFYVSTKYLAYGDLAKVYITLAKDTHNDLYADSCLTYLKQSLDYLIKQNRYENAITIGYTYFEYFKYYKRYREGLNFLQRLRKYFDEETTKLKLRNYYDKLRDAYFLLGDYKNAYECVMKQMEYNDAFINDSTMAALATLKTEQAMITENNDRQHAEELHFLERRKLITTIMLLCIMLLLICLLVFYITRILKIRKRNNLVLTLKNQTLNQQKSEIEKQRDEIAIQKNIITEQWQEVETVNKNLIHSINYAQRIQRAAISTIEDVRAIFPDSFVFYRPRDIVSGDFYRCGRCGKYAVMITADCTGHGIPGAFLSMLGLSGLKEYMVSEYDAENPGIVLDKMKNFVKTTLIQSQNGKNLDDGMDMTICCFDMEQMIMHYAIAAQTAYIIREGEAIKLKGDIMPVGSYVHEKEHFQSLTIPIQKGDMIYTFSDGIQDQLGGPDRRKFLQKKLMMLLTFIADKDTDEQHSILVQTIDQWQGNMPQIDDMTLIGIRV